MPIAGWMFWAFILHLGPNDFHDYWLAGRLVLQGHSPYDAQALADLATREHLTFLLGGGYSYPLPFAVAMVPFGALPFEESVVLFNALSIAAFGVSVAGWIVWAHGADPLLGRRRLLLALAAGVYPPVYGTVAMGQANLILFPLLALGTALALDGSGRGRQAAGGVVLGVAAIVKLFPGALVVPLMLGRRFRAAGGILAGAAGALALATALAPWAASGSGGLSSLFDTDAFYTNQSINGFVSRLVLATDRSVAIVPGALDPRALMLGLTAAFGVATLWVLWGARDRLGTRRGLALGLGLALVAGTIGAPKNSFWNESATLLCAGLLLAVEAPDLHPGRLGRIDLALLVTWFGCAVAWAAVWAVEPPAAGPLSAVVTLAWSSSLYGLLALWILFVRRLWRAADPAAAQESATIS